MASLALCLSLLYAAWLVYHDMRQRESVSAASWLVVAWALILGSRPVTSWLDGGLLAHEAYARDEGNPQEAAVYLTLQLAGLIVLVRRRVRVPLIVRDNKALFVFYLFWLASVLWSDYPVITAKRLVKDLGSVTMVLLLLTERDPSMAVRAAFARCAYIGIPLSIVLIRYYPPLGRAYAGYDRSELMYVGVAQHKNTLGTLALCSALFLLWDLLESRAQVRTMIDSLAMTARSVVLAMCWYLLWLVNSATSLFCAIVASLLLVAFRFPTFRRATVRLQPFGLVLALFLVLIDSVLNIKELIVLSLGRDMTLTTRTAMWPIILKFADNPLFGAGFNTFWAGSRLEQLQQYDMLGGIVQAHNGYLETYLNGGWIAVGLLGIVLLVAYGRIQRELALETPESLVRFIALIIALLHNLSEASFNKISLVWLVTLFAVMRYAPPPASPVPGTRLRTPAANARRRLHVESRFGQPRS